MSPKISLINTSIIRFEEELPQIFEELCKICCLPWHVDEEDIA